MSKDQLNPNMAASYEIMEAIVSFCCDCREQFMSRGLYQPKDANNIVFSAMMSAVFTMMVRDLNCEDTQIISEAMLDMHGVANRELNRIREKIADAMKAKQSMN